ncbi:MAG: Crp/Fnr family transcriptional regulator [Ginsengibacter sp.]
MSKNPVVMRENVDNYSPLVSFLNKVFPISKEAMDFLDKNTTLLSVPKKKYILKPGSIASDFYFIVKGVVHGFIKEGEKQITTWINEENEIVGSFRTLGTDRPCEEYLQALEDCELIVIPVVITEQVFEKYPETNTVALRMWEHNYRGAEERAYLGRITSAERKYKKFIESQPNLMSRVPLKYIASYLGMTVETLCRIRARQR